MVTSLSSYISSIPRPLFPLLALIVVVTYSIAHFTLIPYLGFDFSPSTGAVNFLHVSTTSEGLQLGDIIQRVGNVTWEEYASDLNQPLVIVAEAGDVLTIVVEREGVERTISWQVPGASLRLVMSRLTSEWWIAVVFWITGLLGFLFLRPRNRLRALFLILCFSTAVWLAGESSVSRWHIWGGAIKLRTVAWLLLPGYLWFHWYFPRPLREVPNWLYNSSFVVAGILAFVQGMQWLPRTAHFLPIIVALVGSIILLGVQYFYQRSERRSIAFVAIAFAITAIPIVVGSIILSFTDARPNFIGIVFLAFPVLPLAYFYACTRPTLGSLETRANRAVSLYLFLGIIGVSVLLITPYLHRLSRTDGGEVLVTLGIVTAVALLCAVGFAPFERWVERTLLNIPLPSVSLLTTYGVEIATVSTTNDLGILLHDQILESLKVKDALLLRVGESEITLLATLGKPPALLPSSDQIPHFVENSGYYLPLHFSQLPSEFRWVRVILLLRGQNQLEGLWLLGSRDPDDFYAQKEIAMLAAIAAPSGVALTNILRASQLHDMVQANISHWDTEHKRIAHSLHDGVLQDLQILYDKMKNGGRDSRDAYDGLVHYIRHLIRDLRPPSLTYEIAFSDIVQGMVEEFAEQQPEIHWHYQATGDKTLLYTESVTDNLYYITKLACDNSIRHANAKHISVRVHLTATGVKLEIEDDGIGFALEEPLTYHTVLASGHFGLFHMLERAAMINAKFQIQSRIGAGTTVRATWDGHAIGKTDTFAEDENESP